MKEHMPKHQRDQQFPREELKGARKGKQKKKSKILCQKKPTRTGGNITLERGSWQKDDSKTLSPPSRR